MTPSNKSRGWQIYFLLRVIGDCRCRDDDKIELVEKLLI